MGVTDNFGIQALSRTSQTKFQNFRAPNPFSGPSRTLRNGKKFPRTFKDFPERVATLALSASLTHDNSVVKTEALASETGADAESRLDDAASLSS